MTNINNFLNIQGNGKAEAINAITEELINHPLYSSIKSAEDVKIYMFYQVWCVWDFMALLKSVQLALTNTSIYWIPPNDASLGRYVYEVLSTEETDITELGNTHSSHFETYLRAMQQVGADTKPISKFINALKKGKRFEVAISQSDIPVEALEFVKITIKYAKAPLHQTVSVFCLSREGIIPDMFTTFLSNLALEKNMSVFKWYLNRHILVDSDSHGPLSVKLFKTVIGKDEKKLSESLDAALEALNGRKKLLDAILFQINKKNLINEKANH